METMFGWIKMAWCMAFHERHYEFYPSIQAIVCPKCDQKWLEENPDFREAAQRHPK